MKLIITRHGETEENIAGILQGHLPGTLSENGIKQAKKVSLRLKDEEIDFIYSSDLRRAANTAKEIAKYHPNTPINFVEDLRERNWGELQGRKKTEFGLDPNNHSINQINSKEGETTKNLYERAENYLHKIISSHHNNTVLFVCHGGIGKILIAIITGKSLADVDIVEDLKNTSISIFNIDENKNHEIICLNCIKHL